MMGVDILGIRSPNTDSNTHYISLYKLTAVMRRIGNLHSLASPRPRRLTIRARIPISIPIINPCHTLARIAVRIRKLWDLSLLRIAHRRIQDRIALCISLTSINAILVASSLAFNTLPSLLIDINIDEALRAAPPFPADIAFSPPLFLRLSFVLVVLSSFGMSNVFLMKVTEVVTKVILACERILRSCTFRIVAREGILHIWRSVNILEMSFEVRWSTEDILFSSASTWVHAGVFSFLGISVPEVSF